MPNKNTVSPDYSMRDIVTENSEMVKTMFQQVSRINEFLFYDVRVSKDCAGDDKPDCMMTELVHQQDLMKEIVDILGCVLARLG